MIQGGFIMRKAGKIEFRNEIAEQCIGCDLCKDGCLLLEEIDQELVDIATRNPEVEEAYACFLCGQCEAVCPLGLSPANMFAQRRAEAVAAGEIDIDEFRYMFPDRPLTIMSMYRQYNNIDYQDLNLNVNGDIGFFPGCTMMTYAPALTRKIYATLQELYPQLVFLDDCCGKPFYQLGLLSRGEKNRGVLEEKIAGLGIKTLVAACPNCYYELQKVLQGQGIKVVTVYDLIKGLNQVNLNTIPARCTIHDSCPDRFEGVFGQQVRDALQQGSYEISEMEHNRQTTYCCGSGGQVSHFRPDFAQEIVERRIQEATATGADTLVTYCLNCVLNLSKNAPGLKVTHALNLLLGIDEDYNGLKKQVNEMFEGPEGEERWNKIMEESERADDDE